MISIPAENPEEAKAKLFEMAKDMRDVTVVEVIDGDNAKSFAQDVAAQYAMDVDDELAEYPSDEKWN
jgi:hypothetical protein